MELKKITKDYIRENFDDIKSGFVEMIVIGEDYRYKINIKDGFCISMPIDEYLSEDLDKTTKTGSIDGDSSNTIDRIKEIIFEATDITYVDKEEDIMYMTENLMKDDRGLDYYYDVYFNPKIMRW